MRTFQSINNLPVDGIPGPSTWAIIDMRLSGGTATPNTLAQEAPSTTPETTGGITGGIGYIGDWITTKIDSVKYLIGNSGTEFLKVLFAVMLVIGIGMVLWGVYRKYRHRFTPLAQARAATASSEAAMTTASADSNYMTWRLWSNV